MSSLILFVIRAAAVRLSAALRPKPGETRTLPA